MERSFNDFYNGEWQTALEANRLLPDDAWGYPQAEPIPVSWDRSAAWIVFNLLKGTTMARAPRKAAVNDSAAKIIEALAFTKIAVKTDVDQYGKMVYLANGWAMTNNGIIAAGMSLGGNGLTGYVEHGMLTAALGNVGKEMTVSSGEEGIEIKSGDYEVMVPGYDTETMRFAAPDPIPQGGQAYPLNDNFRLALEVAGRVVKDTAEHLRDASIYSLGKALLSTNGVQVVEALIGGDIPPGMVFPKAFANAIGKTDKKILGFTFNPDYKSFTVWFEDQSYIRTNLYPHADYPQGVVTNYAGMFTEFNRLIDTPKGMFEAIAMVTPFGVEGKIAITGGAVCTDWREGQGWFTHKAVKALPDGTWFSGDLVMSFDDATKVYMGDPAVPGSVLLFAGNGWRAAVAGVKRPMPVATPATLPPAAASAPDPATAPAWGQQAPAAAPAAPASAPAAVTPSPGGSLPFTPRSRQNSFHGAEGWDTTAYTLAPGETIEQFANETPRRWGGPGTPDEQRENPPVASAPSTGAPAFAAPATAEAFPAAPAFATAPVQQQPASATFPSDATGGFTPFQQPVQAGAGFTANPAPLQSAPANPAPAGEQAPWQTTVAQSPSEAAPAAPGWNGQQPNATPDFSAFAAFAAND